IGTFGVRSIRAQETAKSLAGQTPIGGKSTRFRTFQVCPKDLLVLLRQFACAAWAGDSGCSASPGCGPYELTHVPCPLTVVRGGGDRRPDGGDHANRQASAWNRDCYSSGDYRRRRGLCQFY